MGSYDRTEPPTTEEKTAEDLTELPEVKPCNSFQSPTIGYSCATSLLAHLSIANYQDTDDGVVVAAGPRLEA